MAKVKNPKKLSHLQKGDFFRFQGQQKIYVFQGGGKVRGFEYVDFDDINAYRRTKTDRLIDFDFEF